MRHKEIIKTLHWLKFYSLKHFCTQFERPALYGLGKDSHQRCLEGRRFAVGGDCELCMGSTPRVFGQTSVWVGGVV